LDGVFNLGKPKVSVLHGNSPGSEERSEPVTVEAFLR